MHNLNDSIEGFMKPLNMKQGLWFFLEDISKNYDTFKDIFQDIYDAEYKDAFMKAGTHIFIH